MSIAHGVMAHLCAHDVRLVSVRAKGSGTSATTWLKQFMTMDGSNVPNQPVPTIPIGIAMNPKEEEMMSCPTSVIGSSDESGIYPANAWTLRRHTNVVLTELTSTSSAALDVHNR
eukprot:6486525-Amphidinium_carterae.1